MSEESIWRDIVKVIRTCPLTNGEGMDFEHCSTCPKCVQVDKFNQRIKCSKLTYLEKKLKAEPATIEEPTSHW